MSEKSRIGEVTERVLSIACWLAPGPRCPRILAVVLMFTAAAGVLGALFYLFAS